MPFIRHKRPERKCDSPQHQPPGMIVLEPGSHTWACPACGFETVVTVPEVRL